MTSLVAIQSLIAQAESETRELKRPGETLWAFLNGEHVMELTITKTRSVSLICPLAIL